MKIFVVDDDAFALRLAGRQLETLGYTDVQSFDAVKAPLALLSADPGAADVILLDLAMPDMDGMELVQHLAKLTYPGVIVFISGMDAGILQAATVLAKGLKLRVAGALKKPCAIDELRLLLDAIPTG
jgi:CheY-like chemotaxis protein